MASGAMPTNPGTVDEKPVLLAALFGDVAIAGVKVATEGAEDDGAGTDGTDGDEGAGTDGDFGAFFASLLATVFADFFLAVDSVGLAID